MRRVTAVIAAFIGLSISSQASALSQFSRACSFGEIPFQLQPHAAALFFLMGAPAYTVNLTTRSDRYEHWILESITTDYGEARFYLFAQSTAYTYEPWGKFYRAWKTRSSRWAAQRPSDAVLRDDKVAIFMHNRGPLYSARAGNPEMYDVLQPTQKMRVGGTHWYVNPKDGGLQPLGKSTAIDCNLGEWGFENR